MSRVRRDDAAALTNRPPQEPPQKTKKPYKVVLESVTQEKKRLRSVVSYDVQAPPGYTFVPVGVRDLTEFCKELSRQKGLNVYVVSTALNNKVYKNPDSLSHHVHRLGHHFRNDIVEKACDSHGYRNRGHRYVRQNAGRSLKTTAIAHRLEAHGRRMGLSEKNASSLQRNEQVRETIKELFPRIPDEDLLAIVSRAFEEGTGRVGDATHVPLPRRVQLAVVAHIRHVYTNYDQLLKLVGWLEARHMVEQPCLDQIVKWRGEGDNNGIVELEDIFQEVIVLDDDEEDDNDGDGTTGSNSETPTKGQDEDRESSIEIIASRILATDLRDEESSSNQECERQEKKHLTRNAFQVQRNKEKTNPVQLRRSQRLAALHREELQRRWNDAQARNQMQQSQPSQASSQLDLRSYPVVSSTVSKDERITPDHRRIGYGVSIPGQDRYYGTSKSKVHLRPNCRLSSPDLQDQDRRIRTQQYLPPQTRSAAFPQQHLPSRRLLSNPYDAITHPKPIRLYEVNEDGTLLQTGPSHTLELQQSPDYDLHAYSNGRSKQSTDPALRLSERVYTSVEHPHPILYTQMATQDVRGVKRKSLPDMASLRGKAKDLGVREFAMLKRIRLTPSDTSIRAPAAEEIIDLTVSPGAATAQYSSYPALYSGPSHTHDVATLDGIHDRSPLFADRSRGDEFSPRNENQVRFGPGAGLRSSHGRGRMFATDIGYHTYEERGANPLPRRNLHRNENIQPREVSAVPMKLTGRSYSQDNPAWHRSRETRYSDSFEEVGRRRPWDVTEVGATLTRGHRLQGRQDLAPTIPQSETQQGLPQFSRGRVTRPSQRESGGSMHG